jgi:protocatechuate 3,4-dioxygenase beta subunit
MSEVRRFRCVVIVLGLALVPMGLRTPAQEMMPGPEQGRPTMAPAGVVSGHVYLPDDVTPAVGARVFLERVRTDRGMYSVPPETQPPSDRHRAPEDAPRTGVDGSFGIPITMRQWDRQPGVYVVRVDLQGYAPLRSGDVTAGAVVRLTLVPGQRIRGIVAGPDDEPMAGVRVTAYWTSYRGGGMRPDGAGQVASAETGPEGEYDLGPIGPGQYDLWATAPDMAPAGRWDVQVSPDRPAQLDFLLAPPAELRGTVVYRGTTDPVAGARLSIYVRDPVAWYSATTGADGTFRLVGLPEGEHVLDVAKGSTTAPTVRMRNARIAIRPDGTMTVISGEVTTEEVLAPTRLVVELAEGETLEQSIEMSAGGSIEGRAVTEDGVPVEGASVDLSHKERVPEWHLEAERTTSRVATTDAEGRFRVDYLWPDRYKITIRNGAERRGDSGWVTVEDQEVTNIEVIVRAR